ncbi:MAG: DUF2530 domain-containing protein [Actinomycetales bacterium]|nr:DUF2530 domain-containing protein [Actinomycetales bacterium]
MTDQRPLRELPPARVRLVPITLAGIALWVVALVVFLAVDASASARDTAIAGVALGLLGLAWSRRMDRKLR